MLSHIYSCGLSGIDGFSVCVETDISNGLPAFDIVGLPDAAVKEAKERIRSAIKNTGFRFPAKLGMSGACVRLTCCGVAALV